MRKLFTLPHRTLKINCNGFSNLNSQPLRAHTQSVPEASTHRKYVPLYDLSPSVGPQCYVAPNATLVGDVSVGHDCTIWYNAVIRGDLNAVSLHSYVVVGERTVIHTAASLPTGFPARVDIGMHVVLQSNCTLYSCTIGNEVLVGHRSIIMEGSKLEDGCAIAPNSVVPPGRIIPANQLWAGNPVQYVRDLEKNEIFQFNTLAKLNSEVGQQHTYEFLPQSSAYLQKDNMESDSNPQEFTGQTVSSDQDYRQQN